MITRSFGNSSVRLDMTVAENLRDKIRGMNGARAEVGFFKALAGRRNKRAQRNLTNPKLAFWLEFGTSKMPARSILRMPLMTKLFAAVKGVDWIGLIMRKGVGHALGVLGAKAEGVIHQAFKTGGWGMWRPLKKFTIRRKGHATILVETRQLENAVTSRVIQP